MENSALLVNIALIVGKDLLNDEKIMEPIESFYKFMQDDEIDYEAECFYLQQQEQNHINQDSENLQTFEFLNQLDDETFENFLHMSKSSFLSLFDSIHGLMLKRHLSNTLTKETAYSLALWKMCRNEHFEEIAIRFNVSFFECQTAIRQFWKLISHNENKFIKWPTKSDLLQNISKPIGIIALRRLDIFLESNDEEVQVIWQIVCNPEGRILDCFVQTLQDYNFDLSPIGKTIQKQGSYTQTYLIGDENFPLRTYLINPILSPLNEKEIIFNHALETPLKCAQNVFDTMAKRFNTLYALESKDLFEVRRIISTICCIHNLCVDINDDYVIRQKETTKLVNWSKPVQIEYDQPNQEVLNFRQKLLDGAFNFENPFF